MTWPSNEDFLNRARVQQLKTITTEPTKEEQTRNKTIAFNIYVNK